VSIRAVRRCAAALAVAGWAVLALGGYARAALPDGTFVRTPNGSIYRIVGGAPLHVLRCDLLGGCPGVVAVADLSQFATFPRDGALAGNRQDGGIYRFAGGAPEWISRCDYGGGCGGTIDVDANALTETAHVRTFPADGTTVGDADDGGIYRFAGGAPEWVSRCDYSPGCGSPVPLDGGTFSHNGTATPSQPHLATLPPDGTTVRNVDDGGVYRFVAGTPELITRCNYGGGCGTPVPLDGGTFGFSGTATPSLPHMRGLPPDGTLVVDADDGGIYRFAGGAPEWISRCNYGGGCAGAVALDGGTFARNGSATPGTIHLRSLPADGTLVTDQDDGGTYRFAGGAPEWISRCDYGGGCGGAVPLDGGTFSHLGTATAALPHMRAVPLNGTYLQLLDAGPFYRVAGGDPIAVADCARLDGHCGGAVHVDSGTLTALGRGHLRTVPLDGTVLRGEPSGALWLINGGRRAATTEGDGAVQLEDAAIARFPLALPPVGAPPPPTRPAPVTPTSEPARKPFDPRFDWTYAKIRGRTLLSLTISRLPNGSRVGVKCRGKGCPFRSRSFKPKHRKLALRALRGHRLAPGAVLTITATGPQGQRKVVTLKMRGGKAGPRHVTRCAATRSARLRSC
jgi:hypothetical protein